MENDLKPSDKLETILGYSPEGDAIRIYDLTRPIKPIGFRPIPTPQQIQQYLHHITHCSADVFFTMLELQHLPHVGLDFDVFDELIARIPPEEKTEQFWTKAIAINPSAFCTLPHKTPEWLNFTLQCFDDLYPNKPFQPLSVLTRIYQSITDPDEAICRAFLQRRPYMINIMPQTTALCEFALAQDARVIEWIQSPTLEMARQAVAANPAYYEKIQDPFIQMLVPKTAAKKTKAAPHIDFEVSALTPQARSAPYTDPLTSAQIDLKQGLNAILSSWFQYKFQADKFWLTWIRAINGEPIVPEYRGYVGDYEHAFAPHSALFQLAEANIYHYFRLIVLTDRIKGFNRYQELFRATNWTPEQFAAFNSTFNLVEIDLYALIEFLNSVQFAEKIINEQYLLGLVLGTSAQQPLLRHIFRHNRQLSTVIMRHFEIFNTRVHIAIHEEDFRQVMRQVARSIPNIDDYLRQLMLAYKNKAIWIDLLDWLTEYPSAINIEFLHTLLRKEKDGYFHFLILRTLQQMGADVDAWFAPDVLLAQAEKILSKFKKPSIAFLDLAALPSLTWKNQQPVEDKIIHAWFLISLDAVQHKHPTWLWHYLDLMDESSCQQLADYLIMQLSHAIKAKNAKNKALLSDSGLLVFAKYATPQVVLHALQEIEQIKQSLKGSNKRQMLTQQRVLIAARLGYLAFDELNTAKMNELEQHYLAELAALKQIS